MPVDHMRVRFGATEFTFRRVSLARHGTSELDYLQSIRSGVLHRISGGHPENTELGKTYHVRLKDNRNRLAALVPAPVHLIIDAPSSRNLHQPYLDAILAAHPEAINLAGRVHKASGVSSGTGASYEEMLAACHLAGVLPNLADVQHVVVVDDVFGTAKTAGVVLALLRPHLPPGVAFTVACPLVVPQPEATLAALGIQHVTLPGPVAAVAQAGQEPVPPDAPGPDGFVATGLGNTATSQRRGCGALLLVVALGLTLLAALTAG